MFKINSAFILFLGFTLGSVFVLFPGYSFQYSQKRRDRKGGCLKQGVGAVTQSQLKQMLEFQNCISNTNH